MTPMTGARLCRRSHRAIAANSFRFPRRQPSRARACLIARPSGNMTILSARRSNVPRSAVLALCFFLTLPAVALSQARPHVIQGRVTSDSGGKPVAAADVIVTVAPSAETITGKTDAAGDYRVVVANPTGEYILNISMLGFRPFRQRVTIARGDSAATVNVHLAPNVTQLAGVKVQATRPRPQRTAGVDNGFGADPSSKTFDGVTNALPPELQGNFDALAAPTP